jgi:NAD(P)-dependent dehydrogenase (short-subunit alcohol dehydrogenase family)
MKKAIIITGTSGDIGGAIARLLHTKDYTIYAPSRKQSMDRLRRTFEGVDNFFVEGIDLENMSEVKSYIASIKEREPFLVGTILAAGGKADNGEFHDYEFTAYENGSIEQKLAAIDGHMRANVRTKETFIRSLVEVYGTTLKEHTKVGAVGSHIQNSPVEQVIEWGEFGYAASMHMVPALVKAYAPFFKETYTSTPGLVRSNLTKDKLAGPLNDPASVVLEPDEFAKQFVADLGL